MACRVSNVIASFNVGYVNLESVARQMRKKDCRVAARAASLEIDVGDNLRFKLHEEGKVTVSGCQDERVCKKAAKKFCSQLEQMEAISNSKQAMGSFRVECVCGIGDVGCELRVVDLAGDRVSCEKMEMHLSPVGLLEFVVPTSKNTRTVKVKVSDRGKVFITGAKCGSEIREAFAVALPLLQRFMLKRYSHTSVAHGKSNPVPVF